MNWATLAISIAALVIACLAEWRQRRIEKSQDHINNIPQVRASLDTKYNSGLPNDFLLRFILLAKEPVTDLQVRIIESKNDDCPIGFTPGDSWVEPEFVRTPDVKPAWEMDHVRYRVRQPDDVPSAITFNETWQMESRGRDHRDPEMVKMTVICRSAETGKPWYLDLPIEISDKARAQLKGSSARFRSFEY